jgi:hypothetical protein
MYIKRCEAMIRTQVYLPEDLYEEVRRVSYERKMSIAGVVREALAEYLLAGKAKAEAVTLEEERELSEEELKNHPLYQIIGMCSSGLGDGAENHDYYIYGGKRA